MSILVTPRPTEKAYGLSVRQNTYIFDVPLTANKQQIIAAVEEQFEVEVKSIKTLVQAGKAIRYSRGKRVMPGTTNRKDTKKAYVTLAEGSSIKLFEEQVEAPKADEKEKK